MQLIETKELMVAGDRFQLNYNEWYRLTQLSSHPMAATKATVECEVLRVYARSSYEVRYICRRCDTDQRSNAFVLGQFLIDAYEVTAKAEGLTVSAMVFHEAKARLGVRSISEFMPTCYTKEDAEAIAAEIRRMKLKERYGYLVPDLDA